MYEITMSLLIDLVPLVPVLVIVVLVFNLIAGLLWNNRGY